VAKNQEGPKFRIKKNRVSNRGLVGGGRQYDRIWWEQPQKDMKPRRGILKTDCKTQIGRQGKSLGKIGVEPTEHPSGGKRKANVNLQYIVSKPEGKVKATIKVEGHKWA